MDPSLEEDTAQESSSMVVARYYFQLTYELANRDITKIEQVNQQSVYLCLNVASLIKDEIIQKNNELKKIKSQPKHV